MKVIKTSIKSLYSIGKGWLGLGLYNLLIKPMQTIHLLPPSQVEEKDHWTISEYKYNQIIYVSLIDKKTNKRFGLANYHMPCAYIKPMVMTIHADMAISRIQYLSNDYPFIFAGDFNILPDSSIYHYMTTGNTNKMDELTFPTPSKLNGMEWKSNIGNGVRSAYALKNNGIEPDFTNYAKVKDDDMFIGTIDYIFLDNDKHWDVINVKKLPSCDDMKNVPLPNNKEPSDHIMISADLQLK